MSDKILLTRNQISKIVNNNPEAIKAFENLFKTATQLTPAQISTLNSLISFVSLGSSVGSDSAHSANVVIDRIIEAAGLEEDGEYLADPASNYASTATSLYDADSLIDAQVKYNSDSISTLWSSGVMTGGDTTDNGDGTVAVAAGTAKLRTSASSHAQLVEADFPATASLSLTDNSANYVYVDYNGGSPIVAVTTSVYGFNCKDTCIIATVTREGTKLNILPAIAMNVDFNAKHRRLLLEVDPFRKVAGGGTLSTSSLALLVTAGAYYYGLNKTPFDAFDTSVAGTANANVFSYYYQNGSGGWTRVANSKNIDATYYDNGSGTLAAMTAGRFKVEYVYMLNDTPSNLAVLYGQTQYNSVGQALRDYPPATLPPAIQGVGALVGRYVVKQGASSTSAVENVSTLTYNTSGVTIHNDLDGLQGGTTDQYYHLTSEQYTSVFSAPYTSAVNFTVPTTIRYIIANRAAQMTITLPSAASYPGKSYTIKTVQNYAVISASSNVVPIGSTTAGTAILSATAGKWATMVSDGTNWVIMAAN